MPSRHAPTLLTLPAEIRNAIFGLVLPEPSSCLTLRRQKPLPLKFKTFEVKPDDRVNDKVPVRTICVALLRTCKQTNLECTELLRWTEHKFIFDSIPLSKCIRQLVDSRFPALPFRHIRDLEVQFEPFSWDTCLGECLGKLGEWVEGGFLKSLTLKAFFFKKNYPYQVQNRSTHFQWAYTQLQKALNTAEAARRGTFLPDGLQQIERKLVFTKEAMEFVVTGLSPHEMIKAARMCVSFHMAFGGEFWIGEELLWKDGKTVLGTQSSS